jgi:chemotaxis protein methyltransferase WspC
MKFLDMGILPEQFQIDAVDISKQSLEKAKKGIYTRNSFRGDYLKFQSRYFIQKGTEYHLSEQIKNTVNFSYGNLLDPNFLSDKKPYDIIFCRNVLIYFDDISKNLTIKKLYSLLKAEGILSVGAAETRLLANSGIDLIRYKFGFVGCKKIGNMEKIKILPTEKNDIISSLKSSQLVGQRRNITASDKQQLNQLSSSHEQVLTKSMLPIGKSTNNLEIKLTEPEKNDLEAIRNLADQGNLAEAISLCNQYLQYDSASVEAHVLLGQIYQAQGWEIKAENYFQKAVYLDPKNYQALLHLALLKEQSGELAKADILRQRIRRLEK